MIALGLAERVPQSVDGIALKPNEQALGDIEDDVENGNGDEAAANLRVFDVVSISTSTEAGRHTALSVHFD